MHAFYCFYLNSYRTDAYLKNLCGHSDQVSVFDLSPLRSLYRGKVVERHTYTAKQIAKYGELGAKLDYRTLPTLAPFSGRPGQRINLVLSILLAIFYSMLAAVKLLFSQIDHVVFYNGHILFFSLFLVIRLKKIAYTTDLGDVLYLVDNPNPWTRQLEESFLRHSQSIVCVSKPFKEYLAERYDIPARRISILSAAIPESFIEHFSAETNRQREAQLHEKIGAGTSATILVYSGGIWNKRIPGVGVKDIQGVESLCEAFELLNERGTTTWLVLLGYSQDAKGLDRFRNGRWKHRLVELGSYEAEDSLHLMALGGGDYLCLPSFPCETYRLYDRFKTIEYLASGKRILAADTKINHHLLGAAGRYYREGCPVSMAQTVINDDSSKNIFSQSSNHKVYEQYNWDKRNEENLIARIILQNKTTERF